MSTVKIIKVRRLKRCVDYGSAYNAMHLDLRSSKLNIISIRYSGELDIDFENTNKVLCLRNTNGIENIDLDAVTDFMNTLNGESVFVHCHMGAVRSKWLANWIADNYNYTLTHLVTELISFK